MIDTVILVIQGGSIRKLHGTHIPEWSLHSKDNAYSKFIKAPTLLQKTDGIYRPRVAGIKRGQSRVLRVEFSVPKLLHRNNLDEVSDIDFGLVVRTLRECLADYGIVVKESAIREAEIVSFHPSKNIILSDGFTVGNVLTELSKVNLTQKMELTKQTFYNGGASLQFWSKSHSFVIYDKKKDYFKSKGGATDKDRLGYTTSFLDEIYQLPEILKLEVRLSEKRKLNEVLEGLGYKKNPSFHEVFNGEMCQKILNQYWRTLVSDNNCFLFSSTTAPQNFLRLIMKNHPEIKQKQALYLVGLIQSAKDDGGITGLRKTLDISNRAWYRLVDDFLKLDFLSENELAWVKDVEDQLSTFNALKLVDLRVKYCKV